MTMFKKAEKKGIFLKAIFWGQPGSGFDVNAIKAADHIKRQPAVIDTTGRVSIYADQVAFGVAEVGRDFNSVFANVEKAIREAEKQQIPVVLNRLSDLWESVLDKQQAVEGNLKGPRSWKVAKAPYHSFKQLLLSCNTHVIATAVETDEFEGTKAVGKIAKFRKADIGEFHLALRFEKNRIAVTHAMTQAIKDVNIRTIDENTINNIIGALNDDNAK